MTPKDLLLLVDRIIMDSQQRSPLAGKLNWKGIRVEPFEVPYYTGYDTTIHITKTRIRYSPSGIQPTIPGLETFIQNLRKLAATPEVNRLSHIRQLSTAYFSSSIAGGHSRLEHILGAFDIAVSLFRKAAEFMKDNERVYDDYRIHRQNIIKAGLVLAFFHDVFHAPYGHVLDPLRPILLPEGEVNRLDKAALTIQLEAAINGKGLVYELLVPSVFTSGDEFKPALDWIQKIIEGLDRPNLPEKFNIIAFVFDILSSEVDHDRLDYVFRDYVHILQSQLYKPSDILAEARVGWRDRSAGEARLMFNRITGSALRDILFWRHKLYAHVYEARDKAPYDEMILHSVIYLLDEYGAFRHPTMRRHDGQETPLGLSFVRLSDHDIHRVINESEIGKGTLVARLLIRDVMTNAPFVFATRHEIDNKHLGQLHLRHINLGKRYKDLVEDLLKNALAIGLQPEAEARGEAFKEIFKSIQEPINVDNESIPPFREEGLYWLIQAFSWHAYHRLQLEKIVWGALKRDWAGFNIWLSNLAENVWQELQSPSNIHRVGASLNIENIRQLIEETPLVFLSMSRLGAKNFTGLLFMDRGDERKAILYDFEQGNTEFLPGVPEDSANNYWIGLVRPQGMPTEVDEALAKILNDILFENGWIDCYIRVLSQDF